MLPGSRRMLELLAVGAVSLIPWTILLAVTLPASREVHQWRAAWVGFDAMLIIAMAATAVLGWRRHRAVFLTGPATAVLLVCDAWFDISFDAGTSDVWVSAALAGLVELPLAAFLIIRGYRLLSMPLRGAGPAKAGVEPPGRLGDRRRPYADVLPAGAGEGPSWPKPGERAAPAPLRIGVVVGSDRPGQDGARIARWVRDLAAARAGVEGELVDPRDYPPPAAAEPYPTANADGEGGRVPAWAARIASFDGFVLVVADHERGGAGRFIGLLSRRYPEWGDKAVGFVTYGEPGHAADPAGAIARLRLLAGELQLADVRDHVALVPEAGDGRAGRFEARDGDREAVGALLGQVVGWSAALASLRRTVTP
jgi:NAD(P)H-dependent FMN reductase